MYHNNIIDLANRARIVVVIHALRRIQTARVGVRACAELTQADTQTDARNVKTPSNEQNLFKDCHACENNDKSRARLRQVM
jgi:hypothetical protein